MRLNLNHNPSILARLSDSLGEFGCPFEKLSEDGIDFGQKQLIYQQPVKDLRLWDFVAFTGLKSIVLDYQNVTFAKKLSDSERLVVNFNAPLSSVDHPNASLLVRNQRPYRMLLYSLSYQIFIDSQTAETLIQTDILTKLRPGSLPRVLSRLEAAILSPRFNLGRMSDLASSLKLADVSAASNELNHLGDMLGCFSSGHES